MLSLEKFDVFYSSLRQALNHCQYEFGGKYPFTKDAQYALLANQYGTMTAFRTEFQSWLFNADKVRLEPYILSVYEKITRYGVYFAELVESYERQFVCNDGRASLDITKYDDLNKSESYRLVQRYVVAIGHLADDMRDQAFEYAKVVLKPFYELTLDSYNIAGKFIPNPIDSSQSSDELVTFSDYIDKDYIEKLMPYLLKHYSNTKPAKIACMLYSLADLDIISPSILSSITILHQALTATFGKIGVRQALNEAINRLGAPNRQQSQTIKQHKEAIQKILQNRNLAN